MRTKYLLAILIGVFVFLSLLTKFIPLLGIDLAISQTLQSIHNPLFARLMVLISWPGDGFSFETLIGISLIALITIGLRAEALMTFVMTSGSAITGSLLKSFVNRPRPELSMVQIYQKLTDNSFPSLHVLLYTVFFGYMFYLAINKVHTPWLKYLIAFGSLFLVLTIGISRIYLGVHWATDILGGYLLGVIFLITTIKLNRKLID